MIKFIILLLSISLMWGQPNSQVFLSSPPPLGLASNAVGISYTGTQGTTQYYYWVVAKYGIGNAVPGGPASANHANGTLSVSNYVTISWQGVSGATGYDVLRTTSRTTPSGACACAVALNVSANSTNDQSNSLLSYTVSSIGQGTAIINLDNTTSGGPIPQISLNGGAFIPIVTGGTSSAAFSSITSGTNSSAAMVVGTGASLTASGSGSIVATNGISGLTTGKVPKAASATSLADSIVSESSGVITVQNGASTTVLNVVTDTGNAFNVKVGSAPIAIIDTNIGYAAPNDRGYYIYSGNGTTGNNTFRANISGVGISAASVYGWGASADAGAGLDTGISRAGVAKVMAIGNGTSGDASGELKALSITITGSTFIFNGLTCSVVMGVINCI